MATGIGISKVALSNDTYAPSLTLIKTVGEKILEKTRFLGPSRYARGIANFLGRGLSWLTGNLDDTDKERYYALLRNLDKSQISVETQVHQEYSLTSAIFNQNKENERRLESNERILRDKIALVTKSMANNSISYNTHFHTIETIDYILSYSLTFLHILTEIENFILFCASGTLHPSVISVGDIHAEIKTIKQYYNESIPGNLT